MARSFISIMYPLYCVLDPAASLAEEFGITAKAIRDIWTQRTWTKTTMPFWTAADEQQFAMRTASKRPKMHHNKAQNCQDNAEFIIDAAQVMMRDVAEQGWLSLNAARSQRLGMQDLELMNEALEWIEKSQH